MSKLREPDIIFKWTNCCRLCLSEESTIDLFSEASISQHFPSKIRTCLNFLIYSGDPMPRKICTTCCMKLNNWFEFRKECIQTEKDLKKRLEPYKRIAFVKEYFDKYMKYEKSSQDGSISMDSMSEYDEDEEFNELGDEDEEEYVEMHSEKLQREDENGVLSDNDKILSSSDCINAERKKLLLNSSKLNKKQDQSEKNNNGNVTGKDGEIGYETGKSTINAQKVNLKNLVQDKNLNELSKKFFSTKNIKILAKVPTVTGNADFEADSYPQNKLGLPKVKTVVNPGRMDSLVKHNVPVQETSNKICPDCGVDFPSEELLALHNCNVIESGVDSDDNENFINPLSFVDTSLSEPTKDISDGECSVSEENHDAAYKIERESEEQVSVTPWKCFVCSEYFKSMTDLKKHFTMPHSSCGHADVNLECEYCKNKFLTKEEFIEHQLVHIDAEIDVNRNDLVKCSVCGEELESEALLEGHKCNADRNNPTEGLDDYACSKCDLTFQDKELFDKHELVHNQQDLFNSIVTPQFTTFEGIEGIDDVGDENNQYDDKKRLQKVVRCFRCGRIFNTAEELEQHDFLKHKNPTPFFCRKCNRRFSARSQLLMHVRSHMRKSAPSGVSKSGDTSSDNTCAICGAKFFLQSDLQSHLKTHKFSPTEESLPPPPPLQRSWQSADSYGDNKIDLFAKFKCSVCSKIFVHSGSIIRHGKNLHKGQAVYPVRLKRPIFLMKRARNLSMPTEKNLKGSQTSKLLNSNNTLTVNTSTNSQQQGQEENYEMDISQESKWDQDPDIMKSDPTLDFGTEKCPFCEKVFKPTYLPRHIKRNHRGEVLDPQMLGRDIPDDSLVCRYCLRSCSNPHNRRVHESIHYPVKMQCTQCKICGQKFFSKATYETHILSCKSVRCGKCNKVFFRHLSLKNHSCIVTLPTENKV